MIYDNIKKKCDEKGISIRSLELQTGLGNGVIGGWRESSPTVEKLQAVANALETTIDALITEK